MDVTLIMVHVWLVMVVTIMAVKGAVSLLWSISVHQDCSLLTYIYIVEVWDDQVSPAAIYVGIATTTFQF